jgi:hypothetical protein
MSVAAALPATTARGRLPVPSRDRRPELAVAELPDSVRAPVGLKTK